jgi:hypothetical protein
MAASNAVQALRNRYLSVSNRVLAVDSALSQVTARFGPNSPGQMQQVSSLILNAKSRAGSSDRGVGLALSPEQIAVLCNASLSRVKINLAVAKDMIVNAPEETAVRNSAIINKLIATSGATLSNLDEMLGSIRSAQDASSSFRRMIGLNGLGEPLTLSAGAIIGLIVGGAAILVLSLYFAYTLLTNYLQSERAHDEAIEACEYNARAGRPCTGNDFQAAIEASRETQTRHGGPDPLAPLFEGIGSGVNALFWIGGISLAAYVAFVTLPAAMAARERLKRESEARLIPNG